MDFKPVFPLTVIRHNRTDIVPEAFRMVVVDEVDKFVDDNVVNNILGSEDKPPAETDSTPRAA